MVSSTIEETSFTSTTIKTTTAISVDCTIPETGCKNGGTCIFTNAGHKVKIIDS